MDWGTSQKRLWKAVHRSSDAGNNLVVEIHFEVDGRPVLFSGTVGPAEPTSLSETRPFSYKVPGGLGLITNCQRSAHGIKKLANM